MSSRGGVREVKGAPIGGTIDENKLQAFMGQVVSDFGASASSVLVVLGERLGLYRAMRGAGALSPEELAARSGTQVRYVREWLNANAAGGYVSYDPATERYTLPPEQAMALADEDSPAYIPGFFSVVLAMSRAVERIESCFRTGEGMAWGEHHECLFHGTERFFRSGYLANLTSSWIPALGDVEQKLERGGLVADVGCGAGASTIIMARRFPRARFLGVDYHQGSVELARERARAAGVEDRVKFEVAGAEDYPGTGFDLVAHFDAFHDLGDPAAAARQVRKTLAPDGAWMIVEPFAHDRVEDNLNPVGRIFYSGSTMLCVPTSLAAKGPALGAQAGEARVRSLVLDAGFSRFRRATQTPFNLVYDARP